MHDNANVLSTALNYECTRDQLDVVRCMVEHRVLRDNVIVLSTALNVTFELYASNNGQLNVVGWVVEHTPIDVNRVLSRGKTAMHCVIWFSENNGCLTGGVKKVARLIYIMMTMSIYRAI